MSSQHLIVYPKDWRFRPSPRLMTEVIHFLQREGIMGGPNPVSPKVGSLDWRLGSRLAQLGIAYSDGFGEIKVLAWDTLVAHYAFDGTTHCPACGQEIDRREWADLMDKLHNDQDDPAFICACGNASTLLGLKHSPPLGAGYFAIEFIDCGPEADMTERPLWKELERVIGAELIWSVNRI